MIKINNVSKIYQIKNKTITALDNINLTINEGKIFGIIGLSGAGKTTLLRLLAGLEKPDKGSIVYNNENLEDILKSNGREFKKNIGVVFQGINLLMMKNVYQNIAFPLQIDHVSKDNIDKRVKELAKIVGLDDKLDAYPSQLSGGQRQRVAIARALACVPGVLLLDEVTSALDPITTIQILELLKEINHSLNVTIIIITHDMKVAKNICDEIAIIEEGKIIELGETNNIIENPQSNFAKLLLEV